MRFTPDSYGSVVLERWSDAARAAALEARRRNAARRKAEGFSPRDFGPAYLSQDKAHAYTEYEAQVWDLPKPYNASRLITHTMDDVVVGREIEVGTKGRKPAVLSALRHEIGHMSDDEEVVARRKKWGARADRHRTTIAGEKFSPRYAKEIGAWKNAIRDTPNNRVVWGETEAALHTYLMNDQEVLTRFRAYMEKFPEAEDHKARLTSYTAAIAKRHTALLKRYATGARRKDTTPRFLSNPTNPNVRRYLRGEAPAVW